MTNIRLVYITTPNEPEAKSLSQLLLEKKLIACANILPKMTSVYEWEGKVCEENECVVILKTREENLTKIKEIVQKEHSYDCPCLLVLPVADGSASFLEWVNQQASHSI